MKDFFLLKLSTRYFEQVFLFQFLNDEGLSNKEYDVLNELFWMIEDYDSENENEETKSALFDVAKKVKSKLES